MKPSRWWGLRLFYWLTGGRPMQHLGFAFMDRVVHREVRYWRDQFGRGWMAFTAWSLFRVRVQERDDV
jgi:hypothetical protein